MALGAEICLFALRFSAWLSPALICITNFSYVKLEEGTSERSDCRRKGKTKVFSPLFLSWLMSQAEAILPSQFQFFLKISSSRVPASIRQAHHGSISPRGATLCGFYNTISSPLFLQPSVIADYCCFNEFCLPCWTLYHLCYL